MMFDTEQLVKLAKRENNLKRPYLYVNPLQGKHIPADPSLTKQMCKVLADEISSRYADEKVFVIGFAETATGIAANVALFLENAVFFENTTREIEVEGDEYIYFTESHSHATEQKLNAARFDEVFLKIDRIVFVEDEVTTGNTICKLINEIKTRSFSEKLRYSIVSVLNSMPDERVHELELVGIECVYLKKISFEYGVEFLAECNKRDVYECDCSECTYYGDIRIVSMVGEIDARIACKIDEYITSTQRFCEYIYENEFIGSMYDEALIIGTEELMFPAIILAGLLQERKACKIVRTHSTTRSPIIAYDYAGYPLHKRYKLRSLYDDDRITYLYNLKKYDKVVVVTDSELISYRGLHSLLAALETEGNSDISVYKWGI